MTAYRKGNRTYVISAINYVLVVDSKEVKELYIRNICDFMDNLESRGYTEVPVKEID